MPQRARRKLIVLLWHADRPVRERVVSYARSVPLRGVRMFYSYSPHGARPFLIPASGKLRESRKPRYDFGPRTRQVKYSVDGNNSGWRCARFSTTSRNSTPFAAHFRGSIRQLLMESSLPARKYY